MSALLRMVSNAEYDAQRAALAPAPATAEPQMHGLVTHLRGLWSSAVQHSVSRHRRMLDCLRRRKGQYSPEHLETIKAQGGSEIFMGITGAKCRAARAWLKDVFSPVGERVFDLSPTPVPELPPEYRAPLIAEAEAAVQAGEVPPEAAEQLLELHRDRLMDELDEEAELRAERMAERIEDVLVEGGFRAAFDAFLDDFVTYPVAFLEGMAMEQRSRLEWVKTAEGRTVPRMRERVVGVFAHVSAFDVFPLPSTVNMAGGLFVRRRLTPAALAAMRGAPYYDTAAIDAVLQQHEVGGLREWVQSDLEREAAQGIDTTFLRSDASQIDALEYKGVISGRYLAEWGVEGLDPNRYYSAECWLIGTRCIMAAINPDYLRSKRLYKASYESIPGSFDGGALPELLADTQDSANVAARALNNNMSIASGPQVWVEMDRIAQGFDATDMYPWKVWQSSTNPQGGAGAGVGFFQPASNANELLAVYERFVRYADDLSGIPQYAVGSDNAAGAGKTASGLSMLLNASSKNLKALVRTIDLHVIEPAITDVFEHLMVHDDDESIKGDLIVKARGSDALLHKESQQQRRAELMATTMNPVDAAIIGRAGRAELLRDTFRAHDLDPSIVPSKEQVAQQEQAEQEARMLAAQQGAGNAI